VVVTLTVPDENNLSKYERLFKKKSFIKDQTYFPARHHRLEDRYLASYLPRYDGRAHNQRMRERQPIPFCDIDSQPMNRKVVHLVYPADLDPTGTGLLEERAECTRPGCLRHYTPSHGYFSVEANYAIKASVIGKPCPRDKCNGVPYHMALIQDGGDTIRRDTHSPSAALIGPRRLVPF
jgi:hypothetical protein